MLEHEALGAQALAHGAEHGRAALRGLHVLAQSHRRPVVLVTVVPAGEGVEAAVAEQVAVIGDLAGVLEQQTARKRTQGKDGGGSQHVRTIARRSARRPALRPSLPCVTSLDRGGPLPKKLFLIDGSNHAFRVQFALPPMNAADGFPTRALYGFTTLFAKILRVHQPDYLAVSFDKGKNFRHDMFPDYKGHRPDMPEDLRAQWPHFPELVEGFGYPCIMVDGYEADDVLGTMAARFASDDVRVYLVTGDKDFGQLVNDNVRILDLMKDEEIDASGVEEKWGVGPDRVIDILGLAGDSSDNIPGVPGIGAKTAAKYLQKYGTLEDVLANWKDIGGKRGTAIDEHAADARLSKELATIALDAPVGVELEDLAPKGLQIDTLRELFEKWDFGKVAQRLLPDEPQVDTSAYRVPTTEDELNEVVAAVRAAGRCGFALETSSSDPLTADILGVALAWGPADAVYVPFDNGQVGYDRAGAKRILGPLLADPSVPKIGHDTKVAYKVGMRRGLPVNGVISDTQLLDYILAAHERGHSLSDMATRYLSYTMSAYAGAAVTGGLFDIVGLDELARNAEYAHIPLLLHDKLMKRMDEGQDSVYETIEMPLVPVLADMEREGIGLDLERFAALRTELTERVAVLEKQCHEAAGREFNVGSVKDLREILFDELELPPQKKTKSGWSTDSSVLEKLQDMHPLPGAILAWRSLSKLLSTYVEKLPDYVADDGRVHTTFHQAVAATGRLSSADPNLQNIPVRTEEGRRIRAAFVPAPGKVFLSCDYSQIELRILAHICGEGTLVESFSNGEDIHRRTASEIFGVPQEEITSDQRTAAKAINFGLIYGMSAFRLAGDLAIPRDEAKSYMDTYFARLPKVQAFIEETKQAVRKKGHVDTLFGRRRIIPNIHSKNYAERMAAEREAVNMRVQGTAADLIKIAMIRVHAALLREGLSARILLQVHDELLLEVPTDEVDRVTDLVRSEMEGVAEFAVPLHVNTAVGDNWNDAHG
ncbi:MAG: DNA polymerase I [Deltaproteobacteria bacterium]|nr:MAG: DNA polymerase I [Deltaproteobacteria bacterium]